LNAGKTRGFLNYRLKFCWPKVIYCTRQPNKLEWEIKKKTGGAKQGANQKSGGAMAHPGPPLESPLVAKQLGVSLLACKSLYDIIQIWRAHTCSFD